MELYQIKYFLALGETLNFTRAAEKCNVSQPSLTRAVQNLEAELGGPLFHRERHRSHLTELGQVMLPYLREVLQQAESAKSQAANFARLEDVTLRLGVMCTIGPAMISTFLRAFRESHPGVEIDILDGSGKELEEMLLQGDIEVGVYGLPEGIDERLHGLSLFSERFVIAVAAGHRFEQQPAVRCRDLDREPYVNRAKCEFARYATDVLHDLGVQVKVVLRSERDDWVQGMIAAGLGFGFFPEFAVTAPDLVQRPLIEPEMQRTIQLVTVRGRPHSPAVGALIRQARTHRWPLQPKIRQPGTNPG
jgi:DNA-binding transcriptional LysR family regulator